MHTSFEYWVSASLVTVAENFENHFPIDVSKLTSIPSIFQVTRSIHKGLFTSILRKKPKLNK